MSAQAAFGVIAQGCLAHIVANVACAHDGSDPEGIHQLRVAIRRLRAALGAFRDVLPKRTYSRLGRDLRWLQRALGAAREWDVFIDDVLAYDRTHAGPNPDREALIALAETARAKAYARCRVVLDDRRCTVLFAELGEHLARADGAGEPILGFAAASLRKRHRHVRRFGKRLGKLDVEAFHGLRIRVKRLRYATEFFADLWPSPRTGAYVGMLKAVQDLTGRMQDGAIAVALLGRLAAKAPPRQRRLANALRRAAEARIQRLRKKIAKPWAKLVGVTPFWKGTVTARARARR